MQFKTVSRRQFIAASAASSFGFTILPRHVLGAPGVTPPSGKLNVGCIGIGGQGGGVTKELASFANVNIAALCAKNAPEAEALIRKHYRKGFELPV
jgi:hypothetical protein